MPRHWACRCALPACPRIDILSCSDPILSCLLWPLDQARASKSALVAFLLAVALACGHAAVFVLYRGCPAPLFAAMGAWAAWALVVPVGCHFIGGRAFGGLSCLLALALAVASVVVSLTAAASEPRCPAILFDYLRGVGLHTSGDDFLA